MWPTIARARRRLTGEPLPGESAETDEPRLEDVVIIFGAGEMYQLREALEELLGESVDRPDTPATFERALETYLSLRGAPGTPTVLRRPALLSTPESWEIHIDGTDRATSRAVRSAGRRGSSARDQHRLSPVRDTIRARSRRVLPPLRTARTASHRRATAELPTCPICYRTVDDDGRLPSLERHGLRVDLVHHQAEHDRHPVGDDDWLESLRQGDRIRIGKWHAPFDTVRRYLVTGQVDAGRNRALAHDAIVTAMTQLKRWGPDGDIFGDLPDWKAARAAVVEMMERYARRRA